MIPSTYPNEMGESEFVGLFEDGSPEWHAQRKTGIGSSEIASAAGVPGAFDSAYMLWQKKMGYLEDQEHEPHVQRMFDMGHYLEPVLDSIAKVERPWEYSYIPGSWRHKDDHTALLNPDRLVWDDKRGIWIGREYKASNRGFENDEVPLKYIAQSEWCRGSLGVPEWQLGAIYGSRDWRWWIIKPGPMGTVSVTNTMTGKVEIVSGVSYPELKDAHKRFMGLLRAGTPPPIDGSEDSYNHVRLQNKEVNEKSDIVVDMQLAKDIHYHDEKLNEHKAELTRLKSEFAQKMGDAKGAFVRDENDKLVRVAYRQVGAHGGAPTLRLSRSRGAKTALATGVQEANK